MSGDIRQRIYGSDLEFMAWIRSQTAELPSHSVKLGVTVNDVDCCIHRYLVDTNETYGTREVQAIMFLEVKTRNGEPIAHQRDTWRKIHALSTSSVRVPETRLSPAKLIRGFGVSFLSLSGATPDNSIQIRWGRYNGKTIDDCNIAWRDIDKNTLFRLLRFDIDPDRFQSRWWRRHHKTKEVVELEQTPLGFPKPVAYTIRS